MACSRMVVKLVEALKLPFPAGVDEELAHSELWSVDLDWSSEAKVLREIAVTSPEKLTTKLVRDTLHTVRLVNQKLTEVDDVMLQYHALKELTLTSNYLTAVSIHSLPPSLKVLELCHNHLSSLESLNLEPTQLQHLGVAYNCIHDIFLTPSHWNSLVSLDVSYNTLTDLPAIIDNFISLPKLRNVALIGNPLSVVPCYRSYIVDSLPHLIYLDDKEVRAVERQDAAMMRKHCSKYPDLVRSALMDFSINGIEGLPSMEDEDKGIEGFIMRTFLVVTHDIVDAKSFRRLVPKETKPVEIPTEISNGHKDDKIAFRPILYGTEVDSNASYCINNLTELAALLRKGIVVELWLKKVVFCKSEDEAIGLGKSGENTMKGEKSGRSTVQSGRSSVNKKTGKLPSKAAKGKSQPTMELPGEGWHISSIDSFLLASFHCPTVALADGMSTMVQHSTAAEVDHGKLNECGIGLTSTESQTIGLDILCVLRNFNSISSLPIID